MRLLLCTILYLVGVIQGAPTTNATTTCEYFEAPSFTNRRLWNIVSGSVLTLFACIYSAIHPNIPSPKDSPFCILRRRLGIMIVALIAPELVVVWAMRQWISAHYAWTQTHSFFVLMGGFMLYVDGEPYRTLLPDEVLELIRKGCIDAPTLTAKRIGDRSKGNAISKGLIIIQVAWFILQLMSRAIYHLETTELETGTLAFAVLNFLTYAVWWNKPLDVQCPYPVYWKSTELKPEDHVHVYVCGSINYAVIYFVYLSVFDYNEDNVVMAAITPFIYLMGFDVPTRKQLRVPTFDGSIELGQSDRVILIFAGVLMATIFGGIHCMAWFFAFPTNQERLLWRISAVAITCTPWIEFLLGAMYDRDVIGAFMAGSAMVILAMLYIASRGILLVLMFTTLRHLHVDAYKTVSWISLVPHL
ncbi:hypothetical protein DEU56DRAFT_749569 [Suillus clintonianus]|uniref:uncharacterized protein n=1 Tax=Suillus clintonianus TaxID=1904413 RepID=UPI001B8760F5|nr:uncharacterized protein DEU56DRAFT_749569 [Suillus clintonianus]KAG2111467.1 hypothetical protein DEU56DRAFT_749569 [Suillus clintonianus]